MSERRSKYNAKKVHADGYTFDSIQEYYRYQDLCLMEKAGAISNLVVHPKYTLKVNGIKICDYTPDYEYIENDKKVTEDVKSKATITYSYKLKKKLMKAIYGIDIVEVM